MAELVLIFLQIFILTDVVLTESMQFGNELKYIGSFRSTSKLQRASNQLYDESNYYISQNAGAWNSAVADCKSLLGANATLVTIETEDEWNFLKKILVNYGFGRKLNMDSFYFSIPFFPNTATDYWTSGMYETSTTQWRWSNNIELSSAAPWGIGYPSSNPNVLLRVVLHYGNQYDANWRSVSYTQLHRYICEVQMSNKAQPCYQINDLAIVLDSSGSIGSDNFETAKQFVGQLAEAFTVYSPSRLSFITYSFSATTHIDLTNTLSTSEIRSEIRNTLYETGGTATHLGINMGITQLTSNYRGVPMNMVVLTDGESNHPALTNVAAKSAINSGIRTFAVGITPYINQQELLEITGYNASRVFTSANFDELIYLLAPLSMKICSS